MAEFKYEITERIAVLSTNASGWERQLNMISWNGKDPKYDIRDWRPRRQQDEQGHQHDPRRAGRAQGHFGRDGTVMENYREQFIELYNKNITRPGADRLLKWLEGTDFFRAPASTKFHGACEQGLVMHSINVYNAMMQHFFTEKRQRGDLCRVRAAARCVQGELLQGQHPQCQERRHRPVGKGPVLPGGGPAAPTATGRRAST